MAIDMTTVKSIIHNNKAVAKIEDGLGNTLWQMTGPAPTQVTITLTNPVSLSLTARTGAAGQYGWVSINQLTQLVASDASATDFFWILPTATVQAIKNHTYTTDQTISSLSLADWYSSYRGTAYVCYIKNNELWCVGNLDNSTANDTPLGTTNDLSKFRLYYPNQYSTDNYFVAVNDSTSTGTGTIKWRFSNNNYLINHTNTYNTSNRNRIQTYTWTAQTGTISYFI